MAAVSNANPNPANKRSHPRDRMRPATPSNDPNMNIETPSQVPDVAAKALTWAGMAMAIVMTCQETVQMHAPMRNAAHETAPSL